MSKTRRFTGVKHLSKGYGDDAFRVCECGRAGFPSRAKAKKFFKRRLMKMNVYKCGRLWHGGTPR